MRGGERVSACGNALFRNSGSNAAVHLYFMLGRERPQMLDLGNIVMVELLSGMPRRNRKYLKHVHLVHERLEMGPGGVRRHRKANFHIILTTFRDNEREVVRHLVMHDDALHRLHKPRLHPLLGPILHEVYLYLALRFESDEVKRIMPERIWRERAIGNINMNPFGEWLDKADFPLHLFPRFGVDGGDYFHLFVFAFFRPAGLAP